jgi:dinuclear metal center YbgI/SA1388 family protein
MLAEDIIKHIENWAPPSVAWDKDNVGLQVGSTQEIIKNIFLCLELSENALDESIKKNCNFIFTHHPFLFKPLKRINTASDPKSKLIEKLIKNNITLYSAHTNLDFSKDGVSYELAKVLKLRNIQFLENENSNQYKLVVFVPKERAEKVAEAMFNKGAGIIGEYEKCSFRINGMGTFLGSENSNPKAGEKGKFETVEEIRLEVLVDSWKLNDVISSMKKAHPYEEPAFDVYVIKNQNVNYGFGAIGSLDKGMSKSEFLNYICNKLNIEQLKFSQGKKTKIQKVAVCGGSGSELLNAAIKNEADAFITADVKYHSFQDGENNILYIDAGHYETEIHSLNAVKRKLEMLINSNKEKIKIYKYTGSTNPVKYFIKGRS